MQLASAGRRQVYSLVWRLALPVIIANLLQSLVNIVDVFLAGRLGPLEIAAVGMGASLRMLFLVAIMAVTTGSMSLAAQARGSGDERELSDVTRQSLSLAVIAAVILSPLGFFGAEPMLRFLNSGGDPAAVQLGTGYLRIIFAGAVFLVINLTVNSLLQGAGDTITPLHLSAGMNLANVVLSYLFMFGPGPFPALGVAGAALGTVASSAMAAVAGVALFYSGRNVISLLPGSYRPDLGYFRQILAIGLPSGLQGISRNGAQVLLIRIVTSTSAGTYGASALAIGLQIESLAFMPGLALSVAATSLVGQSLGAWQLGQARERGNAALGLGLVLMSTMGAVLFSFAPQLVRLFDPTAHPTVISAGTSYLRINALSQPILAVAMILNGALRGAGDTRPGMMGTVVGRLVLVVPLAWLLAFPVGLGVEGVWWALFTGTGVQAAWVGLRWLGRRWIDVALRKSRLYRVHLHRLSQDEQRRFLTEVKAPLMALAGSRELVEDDRVVYLSPLGTVEVSFGDTFQVVSGDQVLRSLERDQSSDAELEHALVEADRQAQAVGGRGAGERP